jgi:hypothetical protein
VDVQSLRNYVRTHLEVDDEELPDDILNVYFQEAFDRTMAADNRWPRYEKTWTVSRVPAATTIHLPDDLNIPSIMSVLSVADGYRLVAINHENAEDMFAPTTMIGTGSPVYYSVWGGDMYLWPNIAPELSADFQLRAYRQPVWSSAASDIPDLDPRLHVTICYFVMSLVYAAQEDEILEGVYLARWDRDLRQQLKMLLEPVRHRPLVLHGGSPIGGVAPWVINPPPPGGP